MARWASWFIALILAGSAVGLFAIAALGNAVQSAFSRPETIKETFNNQNVYEDLLPFAVSAIIQAGHFDTFPVQFSEITKALSPDEWRNITNELVPPQWLQAQIEWVIEVIFRVTEGEIDAINQVIDLSELRNRLQGPEALIAAEQIIASSPNCSNQQLTIIREIYEGVDNLIFPICLPPELWQPVSVQIIADSFGTLSLQLGNDELTIRDVFIDHKTAQVLSLIFEIAGQFVFLLYLLPAALLALVVFVIVRSLKDFGRWLGWTALVCGIAVLVCIFLLQAILVESFTNIVSASNEIERFQSQLGVGFLRSIVSEMTNTLLIHAIIFVVIGFLLHFIALFAPSNQILLPRNSVPIAPDGQPSR